MEQDFLDRDEGEGESEFSPTPKYQTGLSSRLWIGL